MSETILQGPRWHWKCSVDHNMQSNHQKRTICNQSPFLGASVDFSVETMNYGVISFLPLLLLYQKVKSETIPRRYGTPSCPCPVFFLCWCVLPQMFPEGRRWLSFPMTSLCWCSDGFCGLFGLNSIPPVIICHSQMTRSLHWPFSCDII